MESTPTEPLNPHRGSALLPGAAVDGSSIEGPLPSVEPHDGDTIAFEPHANTSTNEHRTEGAETAEVNWQAYPTLPEQMVAMSNGEQVRVAVGDRMDIPSEGGWVSARVESFWFSSDGDQAVELRWNEDGKTHVKFLRATEAASLKRDAGQNFAP